MVGFGWAKPHAVRPLAQSFIFPDLVYFLMAAALPLFSLHAANSCGRCGYLPRSIELGQVAYVVKFLLLAELLQEARARW